MKYLIDLTSLSATNTGIEYVAQNAAISFIKSCNNAKIVLVFNSYVPTEFNKFKNNSNIRIVTLNIKNWKKLRYYSLPKAINKERADFNLFFAFPCPYFANHKNAVTLIHDLTPFKFPETQKLLQNFKWKKMIKKCIRKDKHILTVSDTVKYEIANKFSRGDAKRIYPGVKNPIKDYDTNILEKYNLKKQKYILSVGTFEPRKNYHILADAFKELVKEKNLDYKLVIVGKEGWKFHKIDSDDNVVLLPYQHDEALSTLYNNSALFISPSIYEGFGLPVIEAAKHGLNLLISDISTYQETTKNNAMYFDCHNKEDIKSKIIEALLIKKKQNIKTENFDWSFYGSELLSFLTNKNKYLCICSNSLQIKSGFKIRVEQYYRGLEHFHAVHKYVGNCSNGFYVKNIKSTIDAIFKRQCSLNSKDFSHIKKLLKSGYYSTVFIDNSMYGNVYKIIKKKFPKIKLITHFHNCEVKFFTDSCAYFRMTYKNLLSMLTLWMLKHSENYAVQNSDKLIFISEQDFKSFENIGHKSTVIPACIEDRFRKITNEIFDFEYVLFVGSNFYANIEAIDFLINEVGPHINKKIIILGDDLTRKYQNTHNVLFKTYSNNYEEVFCGACAFVSPVFSGSGSKIKIVESLMWGKKIIATKLSLNGYKYKYADVDVCETADEFIEAINACDGKVIFSEKNRKLYLNNYNMKANLTYFKGV